MAITPVNFDIPAEIAARLEIGDLVRYGGVVRDLEGHIVKHLQEIALPDADEAAGRAIAAARKLANKLDFTDPRFIAGAIIVGVATIGGTLYFLSKKPKRQPTPSLPDWVTSYNAALTRYIGAVQDGSLDAEIIGRLITALDVVREHADDDRIVLDFSTEQAGQLVDLVLEYTKKLASVNSIELDQFGHRSLEPDKSVIVDMRHYLDVQRQIFNEVA